MRNYFVISSFIILFISTSCDCWNDGNGKVFDADTNEPLDSVLAESFIDGEIFNIGMYSDSTGEFFGTTGNTGRCRDLHIVLSKYGYKSMTIINPQDANVYLAK